MNAAIRAVVRTAIVNDMSVVGIEHGYQGTLDKAFREMGMRSVSDTVQRGGTILRTARCMDFHKSECQDTAIANMREAGIEGLVVIGGDGSFRGAQALSAKGFPTIGIPGTIDNDLAYTDYTLGFHTACNTCLEAIDKIRDTSSSHDRFYHNRGHGASLRRHRALHWHRGRRGNDNHPRSLHGVLRDKERT